MGQGLSYYELNCFYEITEANTGFTMDYAIFVTHDFFIFLVNYKGSSVQQNHSVVINTLPATASKAPTNVLYTTFSTFIRTVTSKMI